MSLKGSSEQEVLLTPAEVAKLFRVDPKTVTRWAKAGKITAIRTLGGHRRYRQSEVQVLLKSVPNRGVQLMSDSKNNDPKAKFLEALEKKKKSQTIRNNNTSSSSKVSGGQSSGNTPKMFRRKSGSA